MGASSRSDWSPRVATSEDPHEGYRWQVRIRDAEWGLISQKAVARILIAGRKPTARPKNKGRNWKQTQSN